MSDVGRLLYARYQLCDLEVMRDFLLDFGLQVASEQGDRLFMRGSGDAPWLYEAVRGDSNRFLGLGFELASMADVERLSVLDGSGPIEPVDAPGGGQRVRMRMPDGFQIDAVHGLMPAPVIESRHAVALNNARLKPRKNAAVRIQRGVALANKLGHAVLHVSNHDDSVPWLQQRLGLVVSDYMATPTQPNRPIGSFLRFGQGKTLVDHHCLLVLASDAPGVHHISFELDDIDAVMSSHDYLLERGYTLDCGVGRHLLGSQIFDYWRDPFGFRVEHYTDGDVVNDEHQPSIFAGKAEETTQWGAKPPPHFFEC
jgi:catechol 2,3-dioxygenase-like lactoylglutathione lyase family enzyme